MFYKTKKYLNKLGYSVCDLMVTHPNIYFGIGFSFHLFVPILSIILHATSKANVFPLELKDIPLTDTSYEPYQCFVLKSKRKYEQNEMVDHSLDRNYAISNGMNLMHLYYDSIDVNILEQNTIKKIREFEESLFREMYNKELCNIERNECKLILSPIRLFLEVNPTDLEFQHINATLKTIFYNATLYEKFSARVSKDFQYKNMQFTAKSLKSYVNMEFLVDSVLLEFFHTLMDLHYSNKRYFYMYFDNSQMMGNILMYMIKRDALLIIGCFLFIFLFTCFQTKSLFVTCFGILSILTSFFIGNFFYSVILGIKFISVMHILSVFLILGIGCDNIYVFFDKWKSTQEKKFNNLTARLSNTYQGVGWSMFITSITTAMAFFILFFTRLLLINSFGLFVAIVVLINYVSVLVYFPVCVILYNLHFENVNKPDKLFLAVTRFFGVHYYQFLMKKYTIYIILGIFTVISIITLVFTIRMNVSRYFPQLFVSWTIFGRMEKLKLKHFRAEDYNTHLQIAIVSGFRKADYSKCPFWNFSCNPTVQLDPNFQLNNSQVQIDYQHVAEGHFILSAEGSLTAYFKSELFESNPDEFSAPRNFPVR